MAKMQRLVDQLDWQWRVVRRFVKHLALATLLAAFASGRGGADERGRKTSAAQNSESGVLGIAEPRVETLDYQMYGAIREEAVIRSHVMEYAADLMDGIGPRLTGSPNLKRANEWTRQQFATMGCTNAHVEDWGEFGIGWQQENTWMRMTSPDTAVFIAQALPWSPSTNGVAKASAIWVDIKEEKDFENYRGRLAGRIIFFGELRAVKPADQPLSTRYDDAALNEIRKFPLRQEYSRPTFEARRRRIDFLEKLGRFLASEKPVAVILPSRDGSSSGGSGGTIFDDRRAAMAGAMIYRREHTNQLPVAVTAIESFGRVYRLLKAGIPVTIEIDIDTKITGDHEHGFNTIAEIPGVDPKLSDQIVMVGGHLDSWASATGATDNGAGTVVTMEVMRILTALHVRPRRTIRAALWTGEEQGELGSYGYVKQHFGFTPRSNEPGERDLIESDRKVTGPIQLKPEQQKISAYFNVDNGSGAIRGVYLQGNEMMAPIFAQWIEPLSDLGVTTLTLRNTMETDHVSFDEVGIPAFQFIQDPLEYESRTHHSNMDTYERLRRDDLVQASLVEAIFVYNAAMRDEMLPRKFPLRP